MGNSQSRVKIVLYFICSTLLFAGLFNAAICFAKQIDFEVTVNKTKVSLGSSVQLNLSFQGAQDVPAPDLPKIAGFDQRYLGPSTRMSIINGQVRRSIAHIYTLIPLKVGKLKIPAFSIQYQGQSYNSEPVAIEVVQGPLSPQGQGTSHENRIQGLKERIFLIMQVEQKQAYLNETIPLKIKLYINSLSIKDIQYPEFTHQGFLVDDFDQPLKYQESLNGIAYDVMEFNTDIFALRSGELRLGPAQLKCNLVVKEEPTRRRRSFFDDFFGRYQNYPLNLESIDIPIAILALPEGNQPENFTGAVGNYQFKLQAQPTELKVGDPIKLTMTVSGEGNFKTVKPPALDFAENFKVYDHQTSQEKSAKVFEQVVIPKTDKINQIPAITFSFFNPTTDKYQEIVQGPIPITVKPLPKDQRLQVFEFSQGLGAGVRKKEILGRDIIYIKDSPGRLRPKDKFLCQNKIFLLAQFIPLLSLIAVFMFQKRKQRLRLDVRYARRLRAPKKARKNLQNARRLLREKEKDKFFDAVFKTLQEYLGDKFHLSTAGITANVTQQLKDYNIDDQTLNKLTKCWQNCDLARYAPAGITQEQMLNTFGLLQELIDDLEGMPI